MNDDYYMLQRQYGKAAKRCEECEARELRQHDLEHHREMTPQEMAELYKLKLREKFLQRIAQIDKDVNEIVSRSIEKVVANSLGFEYSTWDKWTVRKESPVGMRIASLAQALIEVRIPDFVARHLGDDSELRKKAIPAMQEAFKENFFWKARDVASKLSEKLAEELLTEQLNQLKKSVEKEPR